MNGTGETKHEASHDSYSFHWAGLHSDHQLFHSVSSKRVSIYTARVVEWKFIDDRCRLGNDFDSLVRRILWNKIEKQDEIQCLKFSLLEI